jgi:hypothetical protein
VPAEAIDRLEAALVGQVVADEHGLAAGERRFSHEVRNRPALAHRGGFDLEHLFARLNVKRGSDCGRGRRDGDACCGLEPWHVAVVKRERSVLALEQRAFVRHGPARQELLRGGERGVRRRRVNEPVPGPSLRAVGAGGGESQRRE